MRSVLLLSQLVAAVFGVPNSRIVGGTDAFAGEFPFVAGITITSFDGVFFCGGTLLTNQWLLTGGQCIYNAISATITLGGLKLTGTEATRITVASDTHYIHPDYKKNSLDADLGLIKLRLPIEFTDYISPINLPTEALPDFSVVVAVGWGQINDQTSGLVSTLQRVSLTTLPNEECRLTYGSQIFDTMVCVDGNYNEGTCTGDSGGPLIQYNLGNEATLVGLSSFFSGNGCESTDPSGYTRIEPYLEWITRVIRDF